jgi:hypothetical protein
MGLTSVLFASSASLACDGWCSRAILPCFYILLNDDVTKPGKRKDFGSAPFSVSLKDSWAFIPFSIFLKKAGLNGLFIEHWTVDVCYEQTLPTRLSSYILKVPIQPVKFISDILYLVSNSGLVVRGVSVHTC